MVNPYSLTFGMEPKEYIKRPEDFLNVLNAFSDDSPENRCLIITGVRGSGKTVFLSELSDYYKNREKWLVIDLNPERDMLESLASKIYDASNLKHLFIRSEFSFSFQGLTFSLHGETPVTDVETLLQRMLDKLTKKGIAVLITVDEATNNQYMKTFTHTFQGFLRSKFNVFLLMTGLYQNVQDLQNQKTLTFLYRSKKITLSPLSLVAIADSYEKNLLMEHKESIKAAKATMGYAFAYQVLGHLLYEEPKRKLTSKVLSNYDLYLSQFVYEKIYSELSQKSIDFLSAIKNFKTTSELEKNFFKNHGEYSVYRKGLIDRGILDGSKRGKISFALPRFDVFLQNMEEFYG